MINIWNIIDNGTSNKFIVLLNKLENYYYELNVQKHTKISVKTCLVSFKAETLWNKVMNSWRILTIGTVFVVLNNKKKTNIIIQYQYWIKIINIYVIYIENQMFVNYNTYVIGYPLLCY